MIKKDIVIGIDKSSLGLQMKSTANDKNTMSLETL